MATEPSIRITVTPARLDLIAEQFDSELLALLTEAFCLQVRTIPGFVAAHWTYATTHGQSPFLFFGKSLRTDTQLVYRGSGPRYTIPAALTGLVLTIQALSHAFARSGNNDLWLWHNALVRDGKEIAAAYGHADNFAALTGGHDIEE